MPFSQVVLPSRCSRGLCSSRDYYHQRRDASSSSSSFASQTLDAVALNPIFENLAVTDHELVLQLRPTGVRGGPARTCVALPLVNKPGTRWPDWRPRKARDRSSFFYGDRALAWIRPSSLESDTPTAPPACETKQKSPLSTRGIIPNQQPPAQANRSIRPWTSSGGCAVRSRTTQTNFQASWDHEQAALKRAKRPPRDPELNDVFSSQVSILACSAPPILPYLAVWRTEELVPAPSTRRLKR
ncbi:hypothetical protein BGY98DRAFT_932602 [Russula aff. rugulosa BPL654]|nr:hypothetical protein BGY98DRAFT_932602 [Russula aff. rugulosa BPL654]